MKSNKGITLIALVVTIIILLILAGVSITTLSGNGLFGRAESSAAKYQAASEAENSTISSLMDKYDRYANETEQGVTVMWSEAIAEMGSYLNSANPSAQKSSNYYDKQVVAIKPDGTIRLLNPYQASSVKLPIGTKLRFYTYRDTDSVATVLIFFSDGIDYEKDETEADGRLTYMEYTITEDVGFALGVDDRRPKTLNSPDMEYIWSLAHYDPAEGYSEEIR